MDLLKSLVKPSDPFLHSLKLGANSFPGVWSAMFPAELQKLRFPDERRSTCLNCPKACYENYRADYRCCTYLPQISNFLLGLASETPAGNQAIDRLIARGLLLPEGMHYSPSQWIDFLDDEQNDAFGRSGKVLCPMLDSASGYCNIHAFRNSVCSTYFCYNDHGGAGESFWAQLQTLGSTLETALAQWSLESIGFDLDRYFKTFDKLAENIQDVSTEAGWQREALSRLWGNWYGREKQLLRDCAAVIVQHRDQLWTLANQQVIRESDAFDKAMVKSVPKHLAQQVDVEGMGDYEGEILRPEEIWQGCLEAHANLWAWPEVCYALSSKIIFVDNQRKTPEELHYGSKDFFIEYRYQETAGEPAWRLGLSSEEKIFLELFASKPRRLNSKLLQEPKARALPHVQNFISEMLNRKVLWPTPAAVSKHS